MLSKVAQKDKCLYPSFRFFVFCVQIGAQEKAKKLEGVRDTGGGQYILGKAEVERWNMDGGVKKTWATRNMGIWGYEKPYRSLLSHTPT